MRRSMGRRGNMNSAGGPLMTGHLQDIDMELELLKRKREMIEQQQQLLVMEQQFKSSRQSYDQMRYDEPQQHGSNRDFTHLYETGPKYRNLFGKKRQPEFSWQYDASPKRTASKKKNNQSQFNTGPANVRHQRPMPGPSQGSKHSPKGPTPLMDVKVKQSIGQRISNQKPPPKPPQKDFTQGKVSKPKATSALNKLASYSVAERKSLVAAATESASDTDVSRMLLPDREPTQQVSGRLELALGAIMKNVRALIDNNSQHASLLRSIQLQRVMKQAVRERIRTVMLGKVVGSLIEILAVYREEFPEETDIDILNIALEAGGVSPEDKNEKIKFIESGDPEQFFKTNMSCFLETKLNEMFTKLEEIYGESPEGNIETSENIIDLPKDAEKNKDKENPEEYRDFLNTSIKVYEIKRMLPRLFKRYVPYLIKLINVDAMYQTTKSAITMKANKKAATIVVLGKQVSEEGQGDAKTNAPVAEVSADNRQNMYNLPYYVKIMGRPTLPKRKVMQSFLNQFNPKSIKKHRTIHNLLFVGFSEKTDFDVMVGADGTVIGRSTLSIRICSKGPTPGQNGENGDASLSKDVSQDEAKNGDVSSDIISSDLDLQITDLLSTIRKSEEEDDRAKESESIDAEMQPAPEEDKTNSDEIITKQEDIKKDEDIIATVKDEATNVTIKDEETNVIIKDEETNVTIIDENIDNQGNTDEIIEDGNPIMSGIEETAVNNTASQENDVSDKVETQNEESTSELKSENAEVTKETNIEDATASNAIINSDVTDKKTENSDDCNKAENNLRKENSDDGNKTENNILKENSEMDTQPPTQTAKTEDEKEDKVGELKTNASGRSTPVRTSARLANVTPSTIRTRRASRLAQN